MAGQDQNIEGSQIQNSQVQLTQAGGDAVSFQNSHDNQVTINKALVQFGQSTSSGVDWHWAMRLLKEKQLPETRKRLMDTLGRDKVLMSVNFREQLSWVGRSPLEAERVLQIEGKPEDTLDPRQLLIETFGREDIARKLLILGSPGAGKTTALLALAEQLMCGALAQPQTVIPVVFELSTWRKGNQSIRDWLIEQLYEQHGGNRKAKLYERWLDRQVLLPLMDGLDELGMERQQKCTQKLKEFAGQYPHLVVCCRTNEFDRVGIKLNTLNGAIRLEPLTNQQIYNFLQNRQSSLWSAVEAHPWLRKLFESPSEGMPGLLRVPLYLALAAQVYDPKQPFENKADLLSQYVDRQLSQDVRESDRRQDLSKKDWAYTTLEQEPNRRRTQQTLTWLAHQLQQAGRVELLIENIRPNWLATQQAQRQYLIFSGLFFGLTIGLIFGLTVGLIVGLIVTRTVGPTVGLIFGLTVGSIVGLAVGLPIGLLSALFEQFLIGLRGLRIFGLHVGLESWHPRSHPNQGIWNALRNFLWTTVISYPLCVVFTFGITELPYTIAQGITNGESSRAILRTLWQALPTLTFLVPSIFLALFVGLLIGEGTACIQHFYLRWLLWQRGIAPWNLAQFLNYCVERRLLQRVGGSYRFLHRELLDHFADRV